VGFGLKIPDQLTNLMEQANFTQSWSEHPTDALAMTPVIGSPFAWHQFRMGRSSLPGTIASLGIGLLASEAAWYGVQRMGGASITSRELFLARGLSSLGLRHGGRSFLGSAFFGSRSAAGLGWGIPAWAVVLGIYEFVHWNIENPAFSRIVHHNKLMLKMYSVE